MKTNENILKKYNVSALVRDILLSQKLTDQQLIEILDDVDYTFEKTKIASLIERLHQARDHQEKVMIAGDYDADGISATTILYKGFKRFGLDVGFYIPDRLKEGYGLNCDTVELAAKKGYTLIVTVDNGVVAYEALDKAKELGVEVIVTDHHTLDKTENYHFDYLMHPSMLNAGFNDLCGAGLALLLVETLLEESIDEFYVYAMVATLADMVSVFGYNRTIIKKGLHILNTKGNVYIENLIHYHNGPIDQTTISFQVVPKLNTAGRLADHVNVNNIVRYFLLENPLEIERVSKDIEALNRQRIDLTKSSYAKMQDPVKIGLMNVFFEDNIHEGLTGLVANRYLNDHHEPILVISKTGDVYKGSGRAPEGFDLYAVLKDSESILETFGGHPQACGFSFRAENKTEFLDNIELKSKEFEIKETEEYYIEVKPESLTLKDIEALNALGPYGVDFEKPLFKVNIESAQAPIVMSERHLKWTLNDLCEVLMFSLGKEQVAKYRKYTDFSAFVNLSINEFRGKKSISMIVEKVCGE